MNKVSRNWFMLSCLILAALVVTSCASRKAAWDAAPETVLGAKVDQQEFDKKMAAADSFWQKRDDEKAARQAIAIYKEALKMAPENTNLLEKLAVSHWFVAYYHLAFQEGSKNKYLKILDQGVTFAERGIMTLSKEFKERLQKGEKIEKIIHLIGKEGVPMMYWYSTNLSLWAKKMVLLPYWLTKTE